MANRSDYDIPVLDQEFEIKKQDYPISPRENFLRFLRHEKPMWMPNWQGSSQMAPRKETDDKTPGEGYTFKNWFGVGFKYSEQQGSPTPLIPVISEVSKWEQELKFPNLDDYDLGTPVPYERDEDLALNAWIPSCGFQELFSFEKFDQALVDMVLEPGACRALFEALVDFNIKVFDLTHGAYHYDYAVYGDDWGTMRAQFFSVDTMRETLLEPTKRYIKHVKDAGLPVIFHNCGKIDAFLPAIAEEIGPDAMDMQPINDVLGFVKRYGATTTSDLQRMNDAFFFDPDTKAADIRAKAREYVDVYGAQAVGNTGVFVNQNFPDAERANEFWDELYKYSLDAYHKL